MVPGDEKAKKEIHDFYDKQHPWPSERGSGGNTIRSSNSGMIFEVSWLACSKATTLRGRGNWSAVRASFC